jgi:NADPH-dependent ferric siderophore reductase
MTMFGEVLEVERLTPHMVRVVLGGDGLAEFTPSEWADQYVNALFVPEGASWSVPFDLDEARRAAPEQRPVGRRYTVRAWDSVKRRLIIDFVVHGDVGLAGRWAANAVPGDRLQITGPSGNYRPDPEAACHLLVGDESALPAIAAALEMVPAAGRAIAVLVVDDAEHEIDLDCPGTLDLTWVHRGDGSGGPEQVVSAVRAVELPDGRVHAFVHGEAGEVRAVRRHLLGERGLPKEGASISPYWRRDFTDERWREVKREWLASVELDV